MGGDGITNPPDLLNLDVIRAFIDGMPVLEETGGELTTDGNEQTVYINNAPAGNFVPVCVKIDFSNHTVTETVVVRVYYRIAPAGVLLIQDEVSYAGPVSPPMLNIDLEPNRYGIEVTMEKTVGTNRAYDWTAMYKV